MKKNIVDDIFETSSYLIHLWEFDDLDVIQNCLTHLNNLEINHYIKQNQGFIAKCKETGLIIGMIYFKEKLSSKKNCMFCSLMEGNWSRDMHFDIIDHMLWYSFNVLDVDEIMLENSSYYLIERLGYKISKSDLENPIKRQHQTRIMHVSKKYSSRLFKVSDIPKILQFYLEQPVYFEHCPPKPSKEVVWKDMFGLPPRKSYGDKYFFGLYTDDELIAVVDIIHGFPNEETLFLGLFMVCAHHQGKGLGSKVIDELVAYARRLGFTGIRLAYVLGNNQSKNFWLNNQFKSTGIISKQALYSVEILERKIKN